jgi:hypothetical protein
MSTGQKNLSRPEASKHLFEKFGIKLSPKTLASKACSGGGPPYYKAGRYPLYPPEELDEYATELLGKLQTSTSDAA